VISSRVDSRVESRAEAGIKIVGHVKIVDEHGNVYEQNNEISSQFLNYLSTFFYQVPNLPVSYALYIAPTSINVPLQLSTVNSNITSSGVGVFQILELEFVSNAIQVTSTISQLVLMMNTITGTTMPVARLNVTNPPSVGTSIRVVWTVTVFVQVQALAIVNFNNVQAIVANALVPNAPSVNSSWSLPTNTQTYVVVGGGTLQVLTQSIYGGGGAFSATVTGVPVNTATNVISLQVYSLGLLVATVDVNLSIFHLSNLPGTLVDVGFVINFS
jgi:hypothetical protein